MKASKIKTFIAAAFALLAIVCSGSAITSAQAQMPFAPGVPGFDPAWLLRNPGVINSLTSPTTILPICKSDDETNCVHVCNKETGKHCDSGYVSKDKRTDEEKWSDTMMFFGVIALMLICFAAHGLRRD